MLHEDRIRVRRILEACDAVRSFIAGRNREDLNTDRMLLFALARAIEIIGEAVGRISTAGQGELPSVPWAFMAGMRNRLAHAYFEIDRDILWRTASNSSLLSLTRFATSTPPTTTD